MLKTINNAVASFESAIAIFMLLLMIVVAFAQAALRNLTLAGVPWANAALEWLNWGDFILQKGTLWLAFLGASLAVHADKHVAIDIVPRLAGPKVSVFLRGVVGILGSIISFYLARAFWDAIAINGLERGAEFEVLAANGAVHVCDATAAELREGGGHAGVFCLVRSALHAFGVQMDTPGAAFQLIVPVMLVVMSVRMFGNGIYEFMRFSRGDFADDPAAHGLTGTVSDVAHDIEEHDHSEKKGGV